MMCVFACATRLLEARMGGGVVGDLCFASPSFLLLCLGLACGSWLQYRTPTALCHLVAAFELVRQGLSSTWNRSTQPPPHLQWSTCFFCHDDHVDGTSSTGSRKLR